MPSRASRWARPVGLPSGERSAPEDLADQLAAAPDAGLGKDRLEMVLDGVRRQGKGVRHLHWSAEQNQGLLQRVRRAAQPGSALLLVDFWTNPAHTEPLQAALMAGEFTVHLRTGDVYSVDEARGWLDRAGWRLVDHHRRRAGGRGVVRAPAGGHQQGAGATDAHRLRSDHARPARPANLERAADPLCGYRRSDGTVLGDPRYVDFTNTVRELGWPGGPGSSFDVLPLIVQAAGEPPRLFDVPTDAVLEVPFSHPRYEWFADLGLSCHAVPAIANMCLEIGGICYPAAPFNGWYMGTEIGARNLADTDRYNLLPLIAGRLGLDTGDERSLRRDRALAELNLAVLHSFDTAGVTIADHHAEFHRFLIHLAREQRAGRITPADWSWIVPPISGAATPVFHRYYDAADLRPNYVHHSSNAPS